MVAGLLLRGWSSLPYVGWIVTPVVSPAFMANQTLIVKVNCCSTAWGYMCSSMTAFTGPASLAGFMSIRNRYMAGMSVKYV